MNSTKIVSIIEKAAKDFLLKMNQEAIETKEASIILHKYITTQKITKGEEKILKEQFYDVLKGLGIGIPFILIPGSTILIPLLIKISRKYNIDIFPSSFNQKK